MTTYTFNYNNILYRLHAELSLPIKPNTKEIYKNVKQYNSSHIFCFRKHLCILKYLCALTMTSIVWIMGTALFIGEGSAVIAASVLNAECY